MPFSTTRLGLVEWIGTDSPTVYRTGNTTNMGILDNAAIYTSGTLGSRPAASGLAGKFYRTTDSGAESLFWSDGTNWYPLGLIPQITGISGSVVSGQALIVVGSSNVTITLPSVAQGACCSVTNRSTGTTTVTGTSIWGQGLAGASSFSLTNVGSAATAMLVSDGSTWNMIAGHQETGWQALSLAGGVVTYNSGYLPSARYDGAIVQLKGVIQNNSGGNILANATLATIPAALQPTSPTVFHYFNGGTGGGNIQVSSTITLSATLSNLATVQLDGISYTLT